MMENPKPGELFIYLRLQPLPKAGVKADNRRIKYMYALARFTGELIMP